MNPAETGGKRARPAHRVHHPGCRVSAGETNCDRTVDESENHEPPAGSPQRMTKGVVGIGIDGETSHISRPPAHCAGIRCKDVEDPDGKQREDDCLANKLACAAGFLSERRWAFEAAEREDSENHPGDNAFEML